LIRPRLIQHIALRSAGASTAPQKLIRPTSHRPHDPRVRLTRPSEPKHSYAKFFAWLLCVLCWTAFGALNPAANERHRKRYGHYSIARLTRAVRDLILIRAADFKRGPVQIPARRDFARPGFTRRTTTHCSLRHIARSRLRRHLRQGRGLARLLHLISVLGDIDTHARRVAAGAKHFTRIRPLILTRAIATQIKRTSAPAPHAVNTS